MTMPNNPNSQQETLVFEGHPALVPNVSALLLAILTLGLDRHGTGASCHLV